MIILKTIGYFFKEQWNKIKMMIYIILATSVYSGISLLLVGDDTWKVVFSFAFLLIFFATIFLIASNGAYNDFKTYKTVL